jgi:hypothetical protein
VATTKGIVVVDFDVRQSMLSCDGSSPASQCDDFTFLVNAHEHSDHTGATAFMPIAASLATRRARPG